MKALEARAVVLERLRGTLKELQNRAPSVPSLPGALPKLASGGGGAGLALWALRRSMKRSRGKPKETKRERKAQATTAVSVKVFPSGTAVAIVAAAAIWAGVKIFETQRRGPRGSGSVSPLRKGA